MAVRIRLKRMGAKKIPFYRVVVADARSPVKGKCIEEIGWYDPRKKQVRIDPQRVKEWVSRGAQITPTVKKILKNFGILSREEIE